jgi:hypothetical protein
MMAALLKALPANSSLGIYLGIAPENAHRVNITLARMARMTAAPMRESCVISARNPFDRWAELSFFEIDRRWRD